MLIVNGVRQTAGMACCLSPHVSQPRRFFQALLIDFDPAEIDFDLARPCLSADSALQQRPPDVVLQEPQEAQCETGLKFHQGRERNLQHHGIGAAQRLDRGVPLGVLGLRGKDRHLADQATGTDRLRQGQLGRHHAFVHDVHGVRHVASPEQDVSRAELHRRDGLGQTLTLRLGEQVERLGVDDKGRDHFTSEGVGRGHEELLLGTKCAIQRRS